MVRGFDRDTHAPEEAQAVLLRRILQRNSATEYGQRYNFAGIKSAVEFTRRVSVVTFADLATDVERMKSGEQGVLTRSAPVFYNVTSGTTDKPKFIPVTLEGQSLLGGLVRQWFCRTFRDHPTMLNGAALCVAGAAEEGQTSAGVPYGSASGIMSRLLPPALRRGFVLPPEVAAISDYDLRYYVMARLALGRDVSFAVTPNPMTLVKIAEAGVAHQDAIIASIRSGVLMAEPLFEICPADSRLIEDIEAGLQPAPVRAAFLENVMVQHGRLLPSACWPNLAVVGCWLGGSIGYHADRLCPFYGEKVPLRDLGYLASEGPMSIPDQDRLPAGILALRNQYYEFVPEDEEPQSCSQPLCAHQVEVGRRYRVLLTNVNGLYRYDINDIVEIHSFYNRTPVVAFVRKAGDVLNVMGEKVHVNQLMQTLCVLRDELGIGISQFRAVPDMAGARHAFLVCLDESVPEERLRAEMIPLLDRTLAEVNVEYASKRKSGRLNPPCLYLMDARWLQWGGGMACGGGRQDAQAKWRSIAFEMTPEERKLITRTVGVI